MKPSIFPLLSADPAVRATLGTSPVRVFPFGQAPENVQDPYCVWQFTGTPENYINNQRPHVDSHAVQFDIYGVSAASVESAGNAIQDAIEGFKHATISSFGATTRDAATGRYRYTLHADWWQTRS